MKLDAKIPSGPLAEKWSRHRNHIKLINPANKRKFDVIVVGSGLAGGAAAGARAMRQAFDAAVDGQPLVEKAKELYDKGLKSVLLFGIPEHKDEHGLVACEHNGIVQKAARALKKEVPGLYLIADVCNCEYTTHGHCGSIVNGDVDNDLTLVTLAKQSVSLAEEGIDMVAPSDMMDGRVGAIRQALDANGFQMTPIMAYSAKYASAFYGPFREAAESTPQFGDRRTYQMDPANSNEALREVALDIEEGADIVMVKPALSYLDIIQRVKTNFNMPVAAYNVSGEFAMVKAAAEKGWIDEKRIVHEILTSIKRAGSDIIITYHAQDVLGDL